MNVLDTGSTAANTGTLSTTLAGQGLLTGLGMGSTGVTYSNLGELNISLGNGNNTFNILSTQAGTTTTLNNGSGHSTVNVGSLAPLTGGNVNGIQGALTVNDDNYGTLNVDDTGSTAPNTGTLTNSTLTGLGMAGITYNHLAALNISLGSGANTFNITSTSQNTATTLYVTQGSGDVINVGSVAPQWNGQLNNIQGPLTVVGNGSDIMNVEDGGGPSSNGNVTSTTLTGFGMGGQGAITYRGLSNLNLSVDDGNFTVSSTQAGTTTSIDLQSTIGQTNITTLPGLAETSPESTPP
jgi:acrosin